MSPLPRLILISGWAHDSSAMEELRKCLENIADVCVVSCSNLMYRNFNPLQFSPDLTESRDRTASTSDCCSGRSRERQSCRRPNLWSAKTIMRAPSSYAQNLAKMIEETGGKVFIAGWSLGGMVALETAAYRPDLVAGLVLISSTPKFCAGQNWKSGVSSGALRAMKAMLKRDPRNVFATFFKNTATPFAEEKETIALKIEKACAMNPLELSAGLEYLSETDLRNEATKVNCPPLILHGKEDAIIPVEAGLALKSLLPISKMRVYENCGHGLPWQNPQTAAEDISKFIGNCLGG